MEHPNNDPKERRKLFDKTVTDWWKEMLPANEKPGQPNYRGDVAELKRCKTLAELLFVRRCQVLRWQLLKADYAKSDAKYPAVAAIAGILARIEQPTDKKFPVWLAQFKPNGEPRVGESRFRKLASLKSLDELFPALIRVLPLADKTAPAASLAYDLYHWGEKTRQRWTMEYYAELLEEEEKHKKSG